MGANIIITEVDEPKTLTDLDELKTPKVGGGYEYWVRKSQTKLTTKHITKNGTYTAASDGYYGFKQVTVNVPGGSGSANSSGKPSGLDGGDIPPGGAGSAIVGTDPETGNEEVVGVDEQGNLVHTSIPSGIWVRTPPDDTEYKEGETIVYDGIVVSPIKKDQSTFVDERYPAGKIPFEELFFPVEKAPESGGGGGSFEGNLPVVSAAGTYLGSCDNGSRKFYKENDGPAYAWFDTRGTCGPELLSTSLENVQWNLGSSIVSYTVNGTTWYINYGYHAYGAYDTAGLPDVGEGWYSWTQDEFEAFLEEYGINSDFRTKAKIPVQWKSPYDGKTYEDKFEITITGSSHSTESSSGTEGSGGGGTF